MLCFIILCLAYYGESYMDKEPVFNFDRIYLKDSSVEFPGDNAVFILGKGNPEWSLAVDIRNEVLSENKYRSVLVATATGKVGEDVVCLVEAHMAGIFHLENFSPEQTEVIQNVELPTIIFPYLRETISDFTNRLGLGGVLLNPLNFSAIYQAKLQQDLINASAS